MMQCVLSLPVWCEDYLAKRGRHESDEEKMELAVALARENVLRGTGGPFGAAVYDGKGTLVAVGVNTVDANRCSHAHAEMMALMFAQQALGRVRLGVGADSGYVLASSAQPCSMCFGALPWAGIERLLCGALREDVEDIAGFCEGPVPENWTEILLGYGIATVTGILREKARQTLCEYRKRGGKLY